VKTNDPLNGCVANVKVLHCLNYSGILLLEEKSLQNKGVGF